MVSGRFVLAGWLKRMAVAVACVGVESESSMGRSHQSGPLLPMLCSTSRSMATRQSNVVLDPDH